MMSRVARRVFWTFLVILALAGGWLASLPLWGVIPGLMVVGVVVWLVLDDLRWWRDVGAMDEYELYMSMARVRYGKTRERLVPPVHEEK